jgi:NADPH-dependent ferric siderophore reductase
MMEAIPNKRRVERVRHEIKQREVTVARVERIGAHFASITFRGDALEDFVSLSFDDHVKFMFTDPSGAPVRRDYTPRHFDREARELTIEFALHGDGYASNWARQATTGQRAIVAGPRGSMIIPVDYDWHLLAGDASALPAIARRLEELPAAVRVIVIVAGDAGNRREFVSGAQFEVQWVDDADQLVDAVRAIELPPGEGFAWCAGEAASMAKLRSVLSEEKSHPREAMRVSAYWKSGVSNHHEDLGS